MPVKYILVVLWLVVFSVQSFSQKFARGADIGWLSEMEDVGRTFYNDNGTEQDVLDILSEHCINSIRLRVWVDPENGGDYCGKADVLAQAKRASDKGFRIMIDFHYSDNWADPGKQYKPASWGTYNTSQLTQAVYDHTYDVLNELKKIGVAPEWVQIGNETNNGMLWDDGRASQHMNNYAAFVSSGNKAAKAVFPNSITIVHVANGWDNDLFRWNIGGLLSNGAQFDAIGMSLYPDPDDWRTMTANCLSNMHDMVSRYNKPIVISEIGMSWSYETEAKAFVEDIIEKNQSLGAKGLGVFWWEPQSYDWNGYDKGAWNPTSKRPTVALDGFMTNCANTDCNGVENGTAFIDDCGACVEGNTGLSACAPVEVNFTVDMTGADVSNGVYITGDMTATGGNWSIVPLNQIKPNIYATSFSLYPETQGGYYFLNADDWNARETVPAECIGYYTADRGYRIPTADTTFFSVWSSCEQKLDCNNTPNGTAYFDDCNVCVGGNTGLVACAVQEIPVKAGWNLISINVRPNDTSIASVFSGLELLLVKNMDSYWMSSQPEIFNSLQTITPGEAYLVKMNENAVLSLSGTPLTDYQFAPLSNNSWKLIGCPFQTETEITDYFNSTNCSIIKGSDGFWIPDGTTNGIEYLKPGKGYFIKKD